MNIKQNVSNGDPTPEGGNLSEGTDSEAVQVTGSEQSKVGNSETAATEATAAGSDSVSELVTAAAAGDSDNELNADSISSDSRSVSVIEVPSVSSNGALAAPSQHFPHSLPKELRLFLAQNGKAHSVHFDKKNRYVLTVGSRLLNNLIRELGQGEGLTLRQSAITDVNHFLQAKAEMAGTSADVWYRIAPIPEGVEIDLGDATHARVRITPGRVEIIDADSETLFFRTPSMQAMVRPAAVGNLKLLKKYVNLDSVAFLLLTAWLSYTLAHPKAASSKFVILVLHGGEGSGKSHICKLIIRLIDPRHIGVQTLPANGKDLAIATQTAHLNCYDNVRGISQAISDNLCIAATGGAITTRQLYTDAEQHVIPLHGALVINGIYSFIDQPDLAQRSLPLHLNPMKEELRKSELEMAQEFERDLPEIQRGLFDLIANVFQQLPAAKVTSPTRMIQFSQWLAAMEMVQGAPAGAFQNVYCDALAEGQRDALLDNSLAAAVLELGEALQEIKWSGTPTELLAVLNTMVSPGTQRSRNWPENAIALSKRLAPLQASLLSQGISVELSRGKTRTVTITKTGGGDRV